MVYFLIRNGKKFITLGDFFNWDTRKVSTQNYLLQSRFFLQLRDPNFQSLHHNALSVSARSEVQKLLDILERHR